MITEQAAATWDRDMDHLFIAIGHRFGCVEPRRRMRDYLRALLAPVARKNSWQLAEHTGHATPDGLQHLLSRARWNPDDIRADLQTYIAEQLGRPDGVLIVDDTGFLTADAACGQDNRFRRMLETSGVGYVLAVPKSQFFLADPRIDMVFEQRAGRTRP